MKYPQIIALLLTATLSLSARAQTPAGAGEPDNRELVQISTINALIKGVYDGSVTIGQMKTLGSFGIGTLNQLDGEMLMLDGNVYQVTGDGKVHNVEDTKKTPFASMTHFRANTTTAGLSADSFEALQKQIDAGIPSKNLFYAVKVTGQFSDIKVRSVTRQQKPYRPLTEVVKEQGVFDYKNTSGTLVGFRCPDFAQGINVAAYHLHFLSNDHIQGGHVLSFEMTDGTVQVDTLNDFRLILPEDEEFLEADLSSRGDEAIHKVENLTGREKE